MSARSILMLKHSDHGSQRVMQTSALITVAVMKGICSPYLSLIFER